MLKQNSNIMNKIKLELCVENYDSAKFARDVGFDSIEVNSALELGGLSPTGGLLDQVAKLAGIEKNIMIRNRPRGFSYTETEYSEMLNELNYILKKDIDGVVFGFLNDDFTINKKRTKEFVKLIHDSDKKAIYHRAFDNVVDPYAALELLIELGVDRILTSGQKESCLDGEYLLKELVDRAENRIEIVAASGVKSDNIERIINKTGTRYLHGSFKNYEKDLTSEKMVSYKGETLGDKYIVLDKKDAEKAIKTINNMR